MVLNDPAEPYAAEEPYSPPTSSPDPYSYTDEVHDQASSISPYFVDPSSVTSSVPNLFPFLGYSKEKLAREMGMRLAELAAHQQRPLSVDEVNAFVFHTSKGAAIASWGTPTGLLVGLSRAIMTKEVYRSPLTGPMKRENGWFDGQRIKLFGREVLRGDHARFFVHMLRTTNYACLNVGLFSVMATLYGAVVQLSGETRDPRLQEIFHVTRRNVDNAATTDEKMNEAEQGRGSPGSERKVGLRQAYLKAQANERAQAVETAKRKRAAATASSKSDDDDDASPVSAEAWYDGFVPDDKTAFNGTTDDDAYNHKNNSNSNNNNTTDNQTQTQPQTQVRKPFLRSPQRSTRNPPRPYSSPQSPGSDDSKPSPPTDDFPPSSSSPSSSSDRPRLGAWERIRRESASADSAWPSDKE